VHLVLPEQVLHLEEQLLILGQVPAVQRVVLEQAVIQVTQDQLVLTVLLAMLLLYFL
jgi:hypothetical protein